jgi:hypothetical protein
VQRPGPRGRYTTYDEHGPIKQYRGEPGPGEPHGQPRPNVKEWPRNVAPDGRTNLGLRGCVNPRRMKSLASLLWPQGRKLVQRSRLRSSFHIKQVQL